MQTNVSGNLNSKVVIEFSYGYLLGNEYFDLGNIES